MSRVGSDPRLNSQDETDGYDLTRKNGRFGV
jgi:hypothetical protein